MLYVTQLNTEPGTDMGWSTWLVLEHDLDLGDVKDDTWRRIDKLLVQVNLDFPSWDEEYEGDAPDRLAEWLKTVTPELEKLGFKVVGPADYIFNSMQ